MHGATTKKKVKFISYTYSTLPLLWNISSIYCPQEQYRQHSALYNLVYSWRYHFSPSEPSTSNGVDDISVTDRSLEPRGIGCSQELNLDPPFNQPLTYWATRIAGDTVSTVTFSLYNRHLIFCMILTRYLHYLLNSWHKCRYYWRVSRHVMSVTRTTAYLNLSVHKVTVPCLVAVTYTILNASHSSDWRAGASQTPNPKILGNDVPQRWQSHTVQLPLPTLQKDSKST
jgi:hypothetical protein